jgi:N-acetylglucosaminyldiphosphoundecaprenol N-acetyl-beta-D-mannosaminyltransferase
MPETMDEALDRVHNAVVNKSPLRIGVINAAKIVKMQTDESLKESVRESDVVYADGMSVVWASRLLGHPLPERLTGIDLMHGILSEGNTHGYKVYCLGATAEVLSSVVEEFRVAYPSVQLVGHHDGYFDESEEEAIASQIRSLQPDILFIAITSPKKENFMARWFEHMRVPVVHGVGGSFDVVAGVVKRAPAAWQRLGLEWLYRVIQEPRRLWKRYLVTNTQFLVLLVRERFEMRRRSE